MINLLQTRPAVPADFRPGALVVLTDGPAGPRLFRVFDVVLGTIPKDSTVTGILVGHVLMDGGDWSPSLRAHIITGPVALVVGLGDGRHLRDRFPALMLAAPTPATGPALCTRCRGPLDLHAVELPVGIGSRAADRPAVLCRGCYDQFADMTVEWTLGPAQPIPTITDRCPNNWHRANPANARRLCPECPTAGPERQRVRLVLFGEPAQDRTPRVIGDYTYALFTSGTATRADGIQIHEPVTGWELSCVPLREPDAAAQATTKLPAIPHTYGGPA